MAERNLVTFMLVKAITIKLKMYMLRSHIHTTFTLNFFIDLLCKGQSLKIIWVIAHGLLSVSCKDLMYPAITFLMFHCVLYCTIDNFYPMS